MQPCNLTMAIDVANLQCFRVRLRKDLNLLLLLKSNSRIDISYTTVPQFNQQRDSFMRITYVVFTQLKT